MSLCMPEDAIRLLSEPFLKRMGFRIVVTDADDTFLAFDTSSNSLFPTSLRILSNIKQ